MALFKDEVDILAQRIDNSMKEWIENLDSGIHDDFESETCENCIYSKRHDDFLECVNMLALGYWSDVGVTDDEKCRRFEAKK